MASEISARQKIGDRILDLRGRGLELERAVPRAYRTWKRGKRGSRKSARR